MPTRFAARAALLLVPLAAAAPLAAQPAVPRVGWQQVLRDDVGTTVSIDLGKITRTRDSTFLVRTEIRFPEPVQLAGGKRADHEIDLEELDCGAVQARGLASGLFLDTTVVTAVELSKAWGPVAENRRAVFDARCEWLLTSFANELETGYELVDLDEQPELANRAAVASAMARAYPPVFREKGDSGIVTVRFRVTAEGRVDLPTVGVVESTNVAFSQAALEVVRTMRFRPARVQQKAVAAWVMLPVSFQVGPTMIEVVPQPRSTRPGDPARPGLPPEIPPSRRPE